MPAGACLPLNTPSTTHSFPCSCPHVHRSTSHSPTMPSFASAHAPLTANDVWLPTSPFACNRKWGVCSYSHSPTTNQNNFSTPNELPPTFHDNHKPHSLNAMSEDMR